MGGERLARLWLQMKSRVSTALVLLLPVFLLPSLSHCRSADKPGVSDLEVDRSWYDQAGTVQSCDGAPAACTVYKDQKNFVDVCVAKGFQAKTCGCLVVCSGKIPGFGLIDDAAVAKKSVADTCPAADQTAINAVVKARVAGSSLDRCLNSHVCNGNLGLCSGGDQAASTHMRALGRQGCSSMVLGSICPEGYQDTLTCPEPLIRSLSQTWAEFENKDGGVLKRCIRSVICSDTKTSCDDTAYHRASTLKQAVNSDGCEYWLRAFCAMGSHAW